jgi:hypothetical protein
MHRNRLSRSLSLLSKADDRDMSSPLDGHRQFTLVTHAIPGNAARNDPSSLRQKIPEEPGVFKVDRQFIQTKSTGASPLK